MPSNSIGPRIRMPPPSCEFANPGENNNYVFIGRDSFFLSLNGYLTPTRKDQPPPRLRGFEATPR